MEIYDFVDVVNDKAQNTRDDFLVGVNVHGVLYEVREVRLDKIGNLIIEIHGGQTGSIK